MKPVKLRSGNRGWRGRLQEVYADFEEFSAYSANYQVAARLGCNTNDAEKIKEFWDSNPMIEGSIDPKDLRLAECNSLLIALAQESIVGSDYEHMNWGLTRIEDFNSFYRVDLEWCNWGRYRITEVRTGQPFPLKFIQRNTDRLGMFQKGRRRNDGIFNPNIWNEPENFDAVLVLKHKGEIFPRFVVWFEGRTYLLKYEQK